MKAALKLIVTLFIVCGIASGSLAFVYAGTKDRIAAFEAMEREEARRKVFPGADAFTESDSYDEWIREKRDRKAGDVFPWTAEKNGAPVGYVYQASAQGYGGVIKIIFGADMDGKVTGLQILSHSETPGLGANIANGDFLAQYAGKTAAQLVLKKDDPSAGTLDAITAATISPRAVTRAVREALYAAGGAGTDATSAATKGGK